MSRGIPTGGIMLTRSAGTRGPRRDMTTTKATEASVGPGYGYIHRKDDYLKRLRRIEGQARGLQRMVDDEKYCIDILTQVSAMTKALQSVALGLLEEHMSHCVVDAAKSGGGAAGLRRVDHAVAHVLLEQAQCHGLQRLRHRRDLGEDVDAVLLVVHHPLQPTRLALDPAQALEVVVLAVDVAVARADGCFGGLRGGHVSPRSAGSCRSRQHDTPSGYSS